MLTPAIQAYGVVGLSIVMAILVASIVALVLDSRRWVREQRAAAAAKRRHPAGRRLPAADTFRPLPDPPTAPLGGRHLDPQ